MHGVQGKLKAVQAWRLHLQQRCSARYTAGRCALSSQAALSLASQGPVRPCHQPARTKLCGAMVMMEGTMVPWLYKVWQLSGSAYIEVQQQGSCGSAKLLCQCLQLLYRTEDGRIMEAVVSGFYAELMAAQLATTLSGFTGNLFADQEEMVEDAHSDKLAALEKTYMAPSGMAT